MSCVILQVTFVNGQYRTKTHILILKVIGCFCKVRKHLSDAVISPLIIYELYGELIDQDGTITQQICMKQNYDHYKTCHIIAITACM
jgi:hypothetical protein